MIQLESPVKRGDIFMKSVEGTLKAGLLCDSAVELLQRVLVTM